MTHASAIRLSAGLNAPTFQAETIFGSPIDLQAYRGHSVLVSFYRNAACAICNLRVHEMIEQYPAFHAAGLEIIAVFESPRENMLQYVGKQDAPFALIADPSAALYDLYGVEVSEEKVNTTMQNPATEGRVQAASAAGFELTREEGSNFFRMPAEFLIDADGIIRQAFYSEVVGEHLPFAVIKAYLAANVTS
ncbi:MAG: peroxiredoxin-like family protein [Chloroflexota bacterium]